MDRKLVVGLGAGGHAKVMLELLRHDPSLHVAGLLEADPESIGRFVLEVPVIGVDEDLQNVRARGIHAGFVGVGSTGDCGIRRRLFLRLVLDIRHPDATVSDSARIGSGVTILARSVVNTGCVLGDNVLVNSGAIIEHDCCLASHVHVASGAVMAGGVTVGDSSHIGVGACVREGTRIGRNAVIGAGSVVVKDVPDDVVVMGVPARIARRRDAQPAENSGNGKACPGALGSVSK
jgi:UDP-perosamine 4-acetyltransferase